MPMTKYIYESMLFNLIKNKISDIEHYSVGEEITLDAYVSYVNVENLFDHLLEQTKTKIYFYGQKKSRFKAIFECSFYKKHGLVPVRLIVHVFESMFRKQLQEKYPFKITKKITTKTQKQSTTIKSSNTQEKLIQTKQNTKIQIIIKINSPKTK